jgi:hypothetical protein
MLPVKQNQEQQIVFRRIRGRIVPIKQNVNKNRQEAIKGLSFLGAGVAASVGAGNLYRKTNRAATNLSSRGFRGLEHLGAAIMFENSQAYKAGKKKSYETVLKTLNRAKNIGKAARPLRLGGQLLSSALIGIGAANLYKATTDQDPNSDLAEAIGSAVATGAFIAGTHGRAGMRQAIKPIYIKAYPALRKLKGLFGF